MFRLYIFSLVYLKYIARAINSDSFLDAAYNKPKNLSTNVFELRLSEWSPSRRRLLKQWAVIIVFYDLWAEKKAWCEHRWQPWLSASIQIHFPAFLFPADTVQVANTMFMICRLSELGSLLELLWDEVVGCCLEQAYNCLISLHKSQKRKSSFS